MIHTIIEKAWKMMSDAQAPFQCWGEVVNTTIVLHQRLLNEGLKRITAMAIKHHTKCHLRCSVDVATPCRILMATKYNIKTIFTI
jgi:hypothetical protein